MEIIKIKPSYLSFNKKTEIACRTCKRYGFKATCPPNIDTKYYKEMIGSYTYGILCYKKYEYDLKKVSWKEAGKESSLDLMQEIWAYRDKLFNEGHYYILAFGAGSCKLCKECSFPCRNPHKSLIPLEGIGVDVVKTMKHFHININFPVTSPFYRVGAIFYD